MTGTPTPVRTGGGGTTFYERVNTALALPNPFGARSRNKGPKVTILIGFTHRRQNEELIVLGADSQITGASSNTSADGDVPKIVAVNFANGTALLAKSGATASADRFEEIFAERAVGHTIKGPRDVANVAEDSIRELRTQLIDRYPAGLPLDQHLLDHDCGFLVAYFFNNQAFIYTLELKSTLANRVRGKVATMGCAASLAKFLLTGVEIDEQGVERIVDVLTCTVELCKLHAAFCGGQIQGGMIDPTGEATVFPHIAAPPGIPDSLSHAARHQALVRRLSGQDQPPPDPSPSS